MISKRAVELIADYGRGRWHKTQDEEWRLQSRQALSDYIASLEAHLAATQARLAAFEEGYDPEAKKPKHISDLEDEIVIFKDKMSWPYIGVFDIDDNKWRCISETPFAFDTDAIKRWFPLPGAKE